MSIIALVHIPVVTGETAATYVARRDESTWFVGGPGFTDDDGSRFQPMAFAALVELDPSILPLQQLAVGHFASRAEKSEAWSFGIVPVGATFLVRYEVRPDDKNPCRDELGGAIANCWIVADSVDSALLETEEHLKETSWVVIERIEAEQVEAEDYDHDEYFRQAQRDGLVVVFHTFPLDELDVN